MMLSTRLIHTSVVFFVVGVGLGMYTGITQDFRFVHVHVHVNLLGWVALGLVGLIYAAHPALQAGWRAHAHYWLHTVGLVIFMGGFAWSSASQTKHVVPIALGSTMVALGVLLFALQIALKLRTSAPIDNAS